MGTQRTWEPKMSRSPAMKMRKCVTILAFFLTFNVLVEGKLNKIEEDNWRDLLTGEWMVGFSANTVEPETRILSSHLSRTKNGLVLSPFHHGKAQTQSRCLLCPIFSNCPWFSGMSTPPSLKIIRCPTGSPMLPSQLPRFYWGVSWV